MDWIKSIDKLPDTGEMVLGFGRYWGEDDMTIELGFRSEVDDPKKPKDWIDFAYKVTHWCYVEPPTE